MWKSLAAGALALAALGMTGGVATAAPPDATDPVQVKAFLDERLPKLLEEERIPGVAASVVAGGRQVAAEGYGIANVDTKQKVVADQTPFPIDSTSKLLTATAVMQLAEQGKVDLHQDVNTYLTGTKVKVPDTFEGKPITLAHLLTHSAGFEELNVGTLGATEDERPDLERHLATNQPARARPPGELPAYSNYGIALAGFVVQARAKVPFEQYVAQHILEPLDMRHTTFEQPPPLGLKESRAAGHRPDGDGNVALAPSVDHLAPAGSAIATVTDMSKFMLAHLGVDQERILKPETANAMKARQFATDDRLPGMGYGFYRGIKSGQNVVQHGGDGPGTHGLLTLLPERGSGIYVVVNGDGIGEQGGGSGAVERVSEAFIEHFYPHENAPSEIVPAKDNGRFAGTYRYSRISDTDVSRALAAMIVTVSVTANADGTLTTNGQLDVDPTKTTMVWQPIGERLFQQKGGTDLLSFKQADDGSVVSMSIGADPTVGWDRLRWYEVPTLHFAVVVGSLLVLLTMLAWPVLALARRTRSGEGGRAARVTAGVMLALLTVFLGGVVYTVLNLSSMVDVILAGSSTVAAFLTLPVIAALLGVGVLAFAVVAWRKRWWTVAGRVQYSAIALAVLGFFAIAYEYNFLAWPW